MASAAATPASVLSSLPEAVLHTLFGGTWLGGGDPAAPASHARPVHAAKVHAPTPVRSPLPHQLGYDEGEDEAHVHVRLHNMPSGARVSSSASGATLHIDAGKGAKSQAGSRPSATGLPGDPALEIATHHFTGGMAGTSVHPADPHGAGANIAHVAPQKRAPQAASGSASPWSLDSLLHLPGKMMVSAAAWEGRLADDAVEGVGEKLGLIKPPKPGTPRKPGTFEQFNRAYTAAIVGGVEDMVGGLWKMEVYANTHPIEFYAGIVKRGWDAAKWVANTDAKILKAGFNAAIESTTAKGRRQLWHDGTQAWDSSVKTALGLYHQAANTVETARRNGTLATLVGDVAGKIVVNVAPALVGAPEISAARLGGSLALKEGVEIGAKTVLKDAATEGTEAGVAKGGAEKAAQTETLSSNPASLERRLGAEDAPESERIEAKAGEAPPKTPDADPEPLERNPNNEAERELEPKPKRKPKQKPDPEPAPKLKSEAKEKKEPITISPFLVRYSQESVSFKKIRGAVEYTYDDILKSMRKEGWTKKPVDIVKMKDGKLTSVDNTRPRAAREAHIDMKANLHDFDEPLSNKQRRRFRETGAKTWGEAATRRIQGQSEEFAKKYPHGSHELPKITGKPAETE